MTQDDTLEGYRRDGESPEQALARLSAVVARAREDEVVSELSGIPSGPDVLASAIRVFGSLSAACSWLSIPAIGLSGRRPLENFQSRDGAQDVIDLLARLEHGQYS